MLYNTKNREQKIKKIIGYDMLCSQLCRILALSKEQQNFKRNSTFNVNSFFNDAHKKKRDNNSQAILIGLH